MDDVCILLYSHWIFGRLTLGVVGTWFCEGGRCVSVEISVGWGSRRPALGSLSDLAPLFLPHRMMGNGVLNVLVVPHPPCVWPPCYEASALGASFLPFWWEGESEVFTVLRGGLCSATSSCSEGSLYMATEGNGGEQREIDVILGNNRRTQINYCLINSATIHIRMQMEPNVQDCPNVKFLFISKRKFWCGLLAAMLFQSCITFFM